MLSLLCVAKLSLGFGFVYLVYYLFGFLFPFNELIFSRFYELYLMYYIQLRAQLFAYFWID